MRVSIISIFFARYLSEFDLRNCHEVKVFQIRRLTKTASNNRQTERKVLLADSQLKLIAFAHEILRTQFDVFFECIDAFNVKRYYFKLTEKNIFLPNVQRPFS